MTDKDDIKVLVEDIRREREILEKKESKLKTREEELTNLLSKASKLSVDEAKKILLEELEKELKEEIAKKIRWAEERVKLEANDKAKEILLDAMKHGATGYVAE